MSLRLVAAMAIACALLLAAPLEVHAQDDTRAQAKEFFRAGQQSYSASQYDVAARAFEEAYSILPDPAIAFSTAQAYRLQFFIDKEPRGLKRAIELYRKYIDEVESGGRRQDAVASLAELEPIMLRLEAQQAQRGQAPIESMRNEVRTHMMITSSVPTAVVRIGEEDALPVPIDKDVEPGQYRVRVSADGYFPYDEVRTVSEGQFHLVPVQLREQPARVEVLGGHGASVSVDGRPVGVLPMRAPIEVSAGTHLVTVGERGHKSWSREITLERGQSVQLRASLQRTGQRKLSYWVGGSSLAAFAVGGLYFAAAAGSNSDAKALERERQDTGLSAEQLQSYRRVVDERDSRRNLGLSFTAAGGLLAVTGVLLYLVDSPSLEAGATSPANPGRPAPAQEDGFAPMALVPSISSESAGLALQGRF